LSINLNKLIEKVRDMDLTCHRSYFTESYATLYHNSNPEKLDFKKIEITI